MAASKKKPTLNPSCIEDFLKNSLKIVKAKEQSFSKFFKFLVVSRNYLYISQRNKIYELSLIGQSHKGEDVFSVSFDDKVPYFYHLSHFSVHVSAFYKLACFLDPNCFHVNALVFSEDEINKLDELMQKLKGKLSFYVANDQTKKPLVQKFATRLYRLRCDMEFFWRELLCLLLIWTSTRSKSLL